MAAVQLVVRFVGAETSNDLRLPGTESQRATDLLDSRCPPQQNGSSPFVFHVAKGKITDTANEQAVGGNLGSVPIASYVPLVLLASAMVLSLAPAMLTLFGGATWWLPGRLARVLPHVDIEGEQGSPPAPAPGPAGEPAPGAAAMRAASRRRR